MAAEGMFSGLLRFLGGKPKHVTTSIESPPDVAPPRQNQEEPNTTPVFSFFVDAPRMQDYTQVGLSVKLWIPKDNPQKVYIYHRDGPGGCLGIVPSEYAGLVGVHLVRGLEYEAVVEERTGTTCKIRCWLISRAETERRKMGEAESLRQELTRAYRPTKSMRLELTTQTPNAVKVGEKLKIEFGSLHSYLQDAKSGRGPYSCQWALAFRNESGQTVGILKHDKDTIQKILKAHFNSYLFDVEVVEAFFELLRVVITPYKGSDQTPS